MRAHRRSLKKALGLSAGLVLISGVGVVVTASRPITTCAVVGQAEALCGWTNPEDMAALPDGRHVIVSEFGHQTGSRPGTIAILDLMTTARTVLYEGAPAATSGPWGADDCVEKPATSFSPHGLHLSERADGRLQLLAVQHGGGESVEMFEVIARDGQWALIWRGCVNAPQESMLNDVVSTPDGGFLVTHMMTQGGNPFGMLLEFVSGSVFGKDTGYVMAWNRGDGFSEMPGTAGVVPNGIQISSDGASVFVNYSNGEIRRLNRLTGELEAQNDQLPPLDNATWTPAGRLVLAAGSGRVLDMVVAGTACGSLDEGVCPAGHLLFEVDPETLRGDPIYRGGRGTPGGTGTVGLVLQDGSILVGTFAGDRIVRVNGVDP